MTSCQFKATFVNKVNIGKLADESKRLYNNVPVSFIKIDPQNPQDIEALERASKEWIYGNFTTNMYHTACAIRNGSKYYNNHGVYGLTSQETDFEKLDSNKILGLIHISPNEDKSTFIEHLQVNPEYLGMDPKYKGIGTGILNSIKLFSSKINCFPAAGRRATLFYLKNDFHKDPSKYNCYFWKKPV